MILTSITIYTISLVFCWFSIHNHYKKCKDINPHILDLFVMICPVTNTIAMFGIIFTEINFDKILKIIFKL